MAWITTYYSHEEGKNWIEKFWKEYSKDLYDSLRSDSNPKDRAIRETAQRLIDGREDSTEKLRRLYEFCQREIVNVYDFEAGYTSDERETMLKKIEDAADVLKYGYGDAYHIDMLFASLAGAAGFDPKYVRISNSKHNKFSKNMVYKWSLQDDAIALQPIEGEPWKFYHPGNRFLPFETLAYQNQQAVALLSNRSDAEFLTTGITRPSENRFLRQGDFELDTLGMLFGKVVFTYSGQYGYIFRDVYEDKSERERIEYLEEEFEDQYGDFTIENLEIENLSDTSKPLVLRFNLKIEGYADRTSTRLFYEPAVFLKGSGRSFAEKEREFDIHYNFLHEVQDKITILPPDGYKLEQSSAPISIIDETSLKHAIQIRVSRKTGKVYYDRDFMVGVPRFPLSSYQSLRDIFGKIYDQDHHLLTLRKVSVEESESPELNGGKEESSEELSPSTTSADSR